MDVVLELPAFGAGAALGLAGALTAGLCGWLARKRIAPFWRGRRLERCVTRLGHAVLRNAQLPDGLGHSLCIEYLVLRDEELLVISLRRYPGTLFAGENLEQWVQRLDGRNHKFPNPLFELDHQIAAVRALVPEAPVRGVLVFTEGGEFPKGKPPRVLCADELSSLAAPREGPSEALRSAWDRLVRNLP